MKETPPRSPGTPEQDLVLLYRARTTEELVFRDELTALAKQRRARVNFLLGSDRGLLSSTS